MNPMNEKNSGCSRTNVETSDKSYVERFAESFRKYLIKARSDLSEMIASYRLGGRKHVRSSVNDFLAYMAMTSDDSCDLITGLIEDFFRSPNLVPAARKLASAANKFAAAFEKGGELEDVRETFLNIENLFRPTRADITIANSDLQKGPVNTWPTVETYKRDGTPKSLDDIQKDVDAALAAAIKENAEDNARGIRAYENDQFSRLVFVEGWKVEEALEEVERRVLAITKNRR
jgi:BMFP domain-containing protein YqiC